MTALTKLFRTTTFRLSLTYLALFSAAAAVAIFYLYWNTTVMLSRQLNQTIEAELTSLAEQYRAGGLDQLVRTVAERSGTPGNSLYLALGLVCEHKRLHLVVSGLCGYGNCRQRQNRHHLV